MSLLQSTQLGLWAYVLNNPNARRDLGGLVEGIEFSTVAPGGFGHLTVDYRIPSSRLAPPELQIFANVALMDGPFTCFEGRWDEPDVAFSATDGELYKLTAQGPSNTLKDDPVDVSYSGKTGLQILTDQLISDSTGTALKRNKSCQLDQDTSGILPDHPSTTFTIGYSGQTFEDVLNSVCALEGDYTWTCWDHLRNKDAVGFPTWYLQVHSRDTSTVSYTALFQDFIDWDIRPTVEYSYNVITLSYKNSATNFNSSVTVQDSRLNADGSQGKAPFPWRRLKKDLQHLTMSSTYATALANAYLNLYQNSQYKITFHLGQVRDANKVVIPLHHVRADANILVPDISFISDSLPVWATFNANLFYIQETTFAERQGEPPQVEIVCDTFSDRMDYLIKRLEAAQEFGKRSQKTHANVHVSGESESGWCGTSWGANAITGDVYEESVTFRTQMASTPTSIALSGISLVNVASVAIPAITQDGFTLAITTSAGGSGRYRATYTTVGN